MRYLVLASVAACALLGCDESHSGSGGSQNPNDTALLVAGSGAPPTGADASKMVNMINSYRARYHHLPLTADGKVAAVAHKYSALLLANYPNPSDSPLTIGRYKLHHVGGTTALQRLHRGGVNDFNSEDEIVAAGPIQKVFSGLTHNTGYKIILLTDKWQRIGIGISGGYWTLLFLDKSS